MGGVFGPQIKIEVAIVRDIKHLVLEPCDNLHFSAHVEQFRRCTGDTRSVDDSFAFNWEAVATTLNFPIGKFIFAIVNSLHPRHSVVEQEFCTLFAGLVAQPAFKKVLFQNIAWFCEKFLGAVWENHPYPFHIQGFDVFWDLQIEVLYSEITEAFTTVDGRTNFGVSFNYDRLQSGSCSMQCSRATTWSSADNENIALLRNFAHEPFVQGEAHEGNGQSGCSPS